MKNIKIKTCSECNCELLSNEKYVCDMCKRMIREYEKEHEDEDD